MRTWITRIVTLLMAAVLLTGCGTAPAEETEELQDVYVDVTEIEVVDLEDEAVALAESPAAVPSMLEVMASGEKVKKNSKAVIDYSHADEGYVMVKFTAKTQKRLKAQVKGPSTTYTYNLTAGEWDAFPLSDGDGSYKVTVYENVTGTKYSAVVSVTCDVKLKDEFGPFLHPNQYVDYANAPKAVAKAEELVKGLEMPLDKVTAIYNYVVDNLSYDKVKATTVQSGYLPVLDTVLTEKKGICFDYASLMTGMLRSQGVPCKLVVGYAGEAYHAWISVWSEETGWVDGAVYFDGVAWQRMDPTFASSSKRSANVMKFIGDGQNYTAKYLY